MGLFSQQPEHDEDWAGLPSEPLRRETEAERLTDAARIDAGGLGVGVGGLGLTLGGVEGTSESIVVPIVPMIEPAATQASGEDE